KDCHVAQVGEWTNADHIASRHELIDDRLVPRVYRHDLLHRCARRFPDDHGLHAELLCVPRCVLSALKSLSSIEPSAGMAPEDHSASEKQARVTLGVIEGPRGMT